MPTPPSPDVQGIFSWLDAATPWQADNGVLVQTIAERQRPDNLHAVLAAELRDTRFPNDLFEECAEILGLEYSAQLVRSVTPTNSNMRRGYFGEMIAARCLQEFDGCWILVQKPSFAITPNQSLPGTDVLAAYVDNGEITSLIFTEAKVRTARDRNVLLQAAQQAISDSQNEFAPIIGFVLRRLYESDKEAFGSFLNYLNRRRVGTTDDFQYVYLVLERGAWSVDDVSDLDEICPLPSGFRVSVVEIENLAQLVGQSYAWIGMVVDEHDDE